MKTELQKDTVKSSTLKSQASHHRSLWLEREKRAREEEKQRQVAEKNAKQEKERLAREARKEVIRREQDRAIREARETRIQEEKVDIHFGLCCFVFLLCCRCLVFLSILWMIKVMYMYMYEEAAVISTTCLGLI